MSCNPAYKSLVKQGYSKIKIGDYEGAYKDFDSSVTLNNHYWLAYANRGASYARIKSYETAMTDFNMAIKLNPWDFMSYTNRGICKENMGDNAGALDDYRKALQLKRKYNSANLNIGALLAKMDSCQEAIPYLNVAIQKEYYSECISRDDLVQLRDKCLNQK